MINYSFGEPKNFVDDLPDDWFAKRPTVLNSSTTETANHPIKKERDLKPYIIGAFIGIVVSFLFNSKD